MKPRGTTTGGGDTPLSTQHGLPPLSSTLAVLQQVPGASGGESTGSASQVLAPGKSNSQRSSSPRPTVVSHSMSEMFLELPDVEKLLAKADTDNEKRTVGTTLEDSKTEGSTSICHARALVIGTLYAKYGAVWVLCDCTLYTHAFTCVPRTSTTTVYPSFRVRLVEVEEVKLLPMERYYDRFVFEVIVEGEGETSLTGRWPSAAVTNGPYLCPDELAGGNLEDGAGIVRLSSTGPSGGGFGTGASSELFPLQPPGEFRSVSGRVSPAPSSGSSASSTTSQLSNGRRQRNSSHSSFALPHRSEKTASVDPVPQQHSIHPEQGHQGGEACTVVTLKALELMELQEWVDGIRQQVEVAQKGGGLATSCAGLRTPAPTANLPLQGITSHRRGSRRQSTASSTGNANSETGSQHSHESSRRSAHSTHSHGSILASFASSAKEETVVLPKHTRADTELPVYGQGYYLLSDREV